MLRLLYKKTGKISTKKGGGRLIRHGRIIRILRYYIYACYNFVHAFRIFVWLHASLGFFACYR